MATLTKTALTRAGVDASTTGAAADGDGDKWANTGREIILVSNGSIASITVTLLYGVGGTIDGQTLTDKTVDIAAGKTKAIGPFPQALYNDATGYAKLSYSDVTTLKILVLSLGL